MKTADLAPTADAVICGTVVTMAADRAVIADGAVAMAGDRISAVGKRAEIVAAQPHARVHGRPTDVVVPGYVNAHQHLSGDRLIQSTIPDDIDAQEAIFDWAVPVHAHHSADDDELSATLSLCEALGNGVTTTVEAGTVAHPDRVAAAARQVGARITLGTWGWDIDNAPFAAPAEEVIDRQRNLLDTDYGPLVSGWVTLVGHDLMSDELVSAASQLARERGTGLTFHMSPSTSDAESYLARTKRRPIEHLEHLGVLGPELLIAHAVHIDDSEVELILKRRVAVAACPWAYLRLGQGTTRAFRHLDIWQRGGRLALGCDTENAGDQIDGLRTAALFAGLAKDTAMEPQGFTAHDAFELLTIGGAEAIGMAERIGSLEPGKQADIVVHDRSSLGWQPQSEDVVRQLVWGSDGRSVRDVWVAGRQVVCNGVVLGVDADELAAAAAQARTALLRRAGIAPDPTWPAR